MSDLCAHSIITLLLTVTSDVRHHNDGHNDIVYMTVLLILSHLDGFFFYIYIYIYIYTLYIYIYTHIYIYIYIGSE